MGLGLRNGLTVFCFFFGTAVAAFGSVNTLDTKMYWFNLKLSLSSCTMSIVKVALKPASKSIAWMVGC